ncbi:MAG: hypothetical protein ABIJ24_06185 [Nitrospinota bacterium]|nr:hypothetical protein [Nitrospinota bacterium]
MGLFGGNKIENYKVLLVNKETGEEKFVKDKANHDRVWLSKIEAVVATRSLEKEYKIKIIKV